MKNSHGNFVEEVRSMMAMEQGQRHNISAGAFPPQEHLQQGK